MDSGWYAMHATALATSSYGNVCVGRTTRGVLVSVETLTIAGCNKALSSARQQADKILDALAAGADPAGIGKSARLHQVLTGRSPERRR